MAGSRLTRQLGDVDPEGLGERVELLRGRPQRPVAPVVPPEVARTLAGEQARSPDGCADLGLAAGDPSLEVGSDALAEGGAHRLTVLTSGAR
jgi:hypothetical protein